MAVIRNCFSHTLDISTVTRVNYTITGLTSETSTFVASGVSLEVSKIFLNDLYQTIIDAGYADAIMDEDEYSITVLGYKFFVLCVSTNGTYYQPVVYIQGYYVHANHTQSSNMQNVYMNGVNANYIGVYSINDTTYSNYSYNIIIRGDNNGIGIYYGSANNYTLQYHLLHIQKCTNLMTGTEIYCVAPYLTTYGNYVYIREIADTYNGVYWSTNTNEMYPHTTVGQNTVSKYICVPQTIVCDNYMLKSVIKGNRNIFTRGKYYKIGSDIYYCEYIDSSDVGMGTNENVLYKVS